MAGQGRRQVGPGDVIAEIETDKATMEVEAVDEGTIAKIVVPGGTEGVKVNALIAILAEDGEECRAPPPRPVRLLSVRRRCDRQQRRKRRRPLKASSQRRRISRQEPGHDPSGGWVPGDAGSRYIQMRRLGPALW
jgi:pyruvate dehydrogenase E2 component (dihydrolipoamide acetyltransferase)